MNKVCKWLRVIVRAPLFLFVGVEVEAATESPADIAEREELEKAEARGDIYTPPELSSEVKLDAQDDPEILALIAGEEGVKVELPVTEEEKKEGNIPRARFNEVLEKQKALEQELLELKGSIVKPAEKVPETVVDPVEEGKKELRELRTEHRKALANALLDPGDEEAQAIVDGLDDKIETLQDHIAEIKAEKVSEKRTASQTAQGKLQAVIDQAYTDFPFLDPNSPLANEKLNKNIIAFRDGLVTQGISLPQALQEAVTAFAPAYAKEKGLAIPATDPNKQETVRLAREKAAREKTSAASLSQPAALIGKGEKETFAINIAALTAAQMAALPEATKARLRGDTL